MVDLLTSEGANLMSTTVHGVQPIHLAAENNHLELIQRLLNETNRVPVNVIDSSKWTPLHYAAAKGLPEATNLLLLHGEKRGRMSSLNSSQF